MIFTRELIEKYNVDVFIAGGGPAGVAAALAAEKEDTRSIQIRDLQEKIVSIGGYVPNRA